MGTITHLHERLRAVPNRIDTEGDVLAAASAVLPALAQLPVAEALGRSGLLAVSVPSDFGGLDVSNLVLAEAVSLVAAVLTRAAAILASHFSALEAIRNAGSEEQRRSAFARAASGEGFLLAGRSSSRLENDAQFRPEGMGFRLEGEAPIATVADADWLAVPAVDPSGETALLLVPRNAPGVTVSETEDKVSAKLGLAGVHVAADSVLTPTRHAALMVESVDRLLLAAVLIGQGRKETEALVAATAAEGDATVASAQAIGWRQVEIETIHALIQRVAAAIDAAQVNPAGGTIAEAHRLATILGITTQRMQTGRTAGEEEEALVVALGLQLIAGADRGAV